MMLGCFLSEFKNYSTADVKIFKNCLAGKVIAYYRSGAGHHRL
jgi:hypothetical protein